jgi:hypothetical protein
MHLPRPASFCFPAQNRKDLTDGDTMSLEP